MEIDPWLKFCLAACPLAAIFVAAFVVKSRKEGAVAESLNIAGGVMTGINWTLNRHGRTFHVDRLGTAISTTNKSGPNFMVRLRTPFAHC